VARLARESNGHRAGVELDAYLLKRLTLGQQAPIDRELIYRQWFEDRLKDPSRCGARLTRVRVAGFSRRRMVRRTQGSIRRAMTIERPEVHVDGELVIEDGEAFLRFLAHGVGRHRAFGFGAMIIVPPGTTYGSG
jgi:CRISPR system Cascade subunit CasE